MKLGIEALTPEWHAHRKQRITATDVPAIYGVSSFKSALDVWSRITGKVEPEQLDEEAAHLRWGRESEALNSAMFAKDADRTVHLSSELFAADNHDWLLATPDAFQGKGRGLPTGKDGGVLELKAPFIFSKGQWEDGIPIQYQVQAVTQMLVCGVTWGSCSALLPPEVMWADIEPSEETRSKIMGVIERFWHENCARDIPPTIIDRKPELTLRALRRLHPLDNGQAVELSPQASDAAREITALKVELKALALREKELKATIQAELGANTYGIIPGTDEGFSWKHGARHEEARAARTVEMRTFRACKNIGAKVGS